MLIVHGVPIHDFHSDGFLPFHRACWGIESRHTDTVETFLNHGVDANVKSKDGKTCLDMTSNKETKKLIRAWGTSNSRNKIKNQRNGMKKQTPSARKRKKEL